ncbi:hypothetical protein [Salinispira pacifica]
MKKGRRLFGYTAIALGAISSVVFISPIFPIGFQAFLLAALFFGAAYWALARPTLPGILNRIAPRLQEPPPPVDPMLPVRILRLARENHGTLTVSEVAIELEVPVSEAEAGLRACVRSSSAVEDFDVRRGFALYRFPEFIERTGPQQESEEEDSEQ